MWWRRHAWIPVWIAVFLTPAALLSLRVIDDTSVALVLPPLLTGMIVLFLVMLAVAMRASVARSVARASPVAAAHSSRRGCSRWR